MRLYDLRTEYRENPMGLTAKAPRFSWKMESQEKDTLQTVYEIHVTDENGKLVWNSGKKVSDQSVLISYEGEALASETLYTVQVSVADNHGNTESVEGTFETGIFDNTEFKAQMITSDFPEEETACPVFGKIFTLEKKVKKARLDALLIIGDDGERGHFRCGAGSRGNGAEVCLLAQLRQAEDLAHILKRNVRVFIFDPHSFCGIDRRAAAHRDDPIRLELDHLLRTLHNGLNRRVRLNAFNQLDLHAGFLQIADCTVQKAETLHGAAAYTDDCTFSFECFQCL